MIEKKITDVSKEDYLQIIALYPTNEQINFVESYFESAKNLAAMLEKVIHSEWIGILNFQKRAETFTKICQIADAQQILGYQDLESSVIAITMLQNFNKKFAKCYSAFVTLVQADKNILILQNSNSETLSEMYRIIKISYNGF